MKLYGYWRSTAAYRVRIALNIKKLGVEHISVHLVKEGGQQHQAGYKKLNPQALVPTLVVNEGAKSLVLTQSLAILEYLDEAHPTQNLLPKNLAERAIVRGMAQLIACDVHPLNNLRILQYLTNELSVTESEKTAWYHRWLAEGFGALEQQLEQYSGVFCYGDKLTQADLCLVPQVYNAKRFNFDLSPYPNVVRINDHCLSLGEFIDAMPENQTDAI